MDRVKVLATESNEAPRDGTIFTTQPGEADVEVVNMPWWRKTLIRTIRTYLQVLVGLLLAEGIGVLDAAGLTVGVPPGEFWQRFLDTAGIALAPAVIALLQNVVELLTRLDAPAFRA
jgi:hypothetical protein